MRCQAHHGGGRSTSPRRTPPTRLGAGRGARLSRTNTASLYRGKRREGGRAPPSSIRRPLTYNGWDTQSRCAVLTNSGGCFPVAPLGIDRGVYRQFPCLFVLLAIAAGGAGTERWLPIASLTRR